MDKFEDSPSLKDKASLSRHVASGITLDRDAHTDESSSISKDGGDLELARTKSAAETMSPVHEFVFVCLLCSAQFVAQIGVMNTLNILHIIGDDLGITNFGILSWFVAGYALTMGTFIFLSGRCGDLFGYKNMLIFGFLWFAIWNVVGGCSVYVHGQGAQVLFIFSRIISGIGPAILLPNALGLLGATYKAGRKRNMIFSLFGACAPGGGVVGGVFGALWALVWWPWTFWTFGIVLVILAALSAIILPSVPIKQELRGLSFKDKMHELDLLGATVGITAMILFNFAWNQAPGFGWEHPYIYVLLIIGVLLFPVFFWIELRVAQRPLIPFDALSIDVIFVMICVGCGWAAFGIYIYYFIQFFQRLRHASPLLSMAYLSPISVSGFLAAITTGYVISRIGPAWVMLCSMLFFLAGNILVATMPVHQSYWAQAFVVTLIIPWGMDMSFPAGTLMLSDAVKKEHQGMAASLVNTIINYSISLGLGIAGTVEVHVNNGGRTEEDELRGYRGGLYVAVGLSAFGVFTSLCFLLKMHLYGKHAQAALV